VKKIQVYILYAFLVAGLGVALLTRCGFLDTERLWPDEALYASYAAQIFKAPAFLFSAEANTHHSALFSLILALGHFWHDSILGDRIMAAALNVTTIFAVFLLGRMMFGVFAGVAAALIMAGNAYYLLQSNLVLIDGALTLGHLLFAMALWRHMATGRRREGVMVGILGIFLVLLKWYAAVFIIPWLVLAYFWSGRVTRRGIGEMVVPLGMIALVFFPYLVFKVIPVMRSGGPVTFFPAPFWYYLEHFPYFLGGLPGTVLWAAGLFYLFKGGNARAQALIIPWILVELVVLSFVSEKDLRYILPVYPCAVLVMGMGISRAVDVFLKHDKLQGVARCGLAFVLLVPVLNLGQGAGAWTLNHSYTGFAEAGQAIKVQDDGRAMVLAGSIRAMHYCSGIREKEFGGRLEPLPRTIQALKDVVSGARSKVILEVDVWEYIQPAWAYPVTSEKLKMLAAMGFVEAKVVFRPIRPGASVPVAWIFTYSPP